jgi:hypothetical protein
MGVTMGVIADKLKKDAEEAEKVLEGSPDIPKEPEAKDPPKEPEVKEPEVKKEGDGEPTEPPKEPGVTEPPKEEPAEQTKEELLTIIEGLKMQLADENNPTAKQQYSTLQGMFNKLNEEVKALREAAAKPAEPEVKPASETHSEILSKLTQDYGDGVTTLITDLIEEKLTEFVGNKVDNKLKAHSDRVDAIENVTGRTAGEIFLSSVTAAVPDWKKINGWSTDGIPQDPKWTVFMNSKAPGTGETYDSLLKRHWDTHNVSAVTEIFNIFKDKYKPAGEIPPAGAPDVNAHIDPDTSAGGGTPPADPKKKTYSKAVVDKFYNDIGRGRFDGSQEERDALDAEYTTAMIEGRVL